MEKIFTLDAWRLALIFVSPFFLSAIGFGELASLAFLGFNGAWIWFLGTGLYERLPKGHFLHLNSFRLYFFMPLVIYAFIFFLAGSYSITIDQFKYLIVPLHLFSLFFWLNAMLFIAKEILCIESNKKNASISECIGLFVAFWFVPFIIGIFFIQPVIRRIFENEKLKPVVSSESGADVPEVAVEDVTYTKRAYTCESGELTIEQEFFQPNAGELVYLNGQPAPTGKYKIGFMKHVIVVDGKVAHELPQPEKEAAQETKPKKEEPKEIVLTRHAYQCDAGELVIEQEYHVPNKGELAYLDGKPAPGGKYKIGFMRTITITNGKVDS